MSQLLEKYMIHALYSQFLIWQPFKGSLVLSSQKQKKIAYIEWHTAVVGASSDYLKLSCIKKGFVNYYVYYIIYY